MLFVHGRSSRRSRLVSIAQDVPVRDVDVTALQAELISTGCNLGQAMRHIKDFEGVSLDFEENYPNWEYSGEKVVIKGESTEFTKK